VPLVVVAVVVLKVVGAGAIFLNIFLSSLDGYEGDG
jgi:hypothetical protein